MNNRLISLLMLLTFTILLFGCNQKNGIIPKQNTDAAKEPAYAIYLIKNAKSFDDIRKLDINSLQIESQPIITDEDIESYSWSNHTIQLKQELNKNGISTIKGIGTPFVVRAEHQNIYAGAFWSSISSASADFPVIIVLEKTLTLQQGYPGGDPEVVPDHRQDNRIYNALKKSGKLE